MKIHPIAPSLQLAIISGLTLFAATLGIAQVKLTSGDAFEKSSFDTAGSWSNGQAPAPGHTYEVSALLRSPANGGHLTFEGDDLTLSAGGIFYYKGKPDHSVTAQIILNGGSITNGGEKPFTLAGTIKLIAPSAILGFKELLTVESTITGDDLSQLRIGSTGLTKPDPDGGVILANKSNSYSGGTLVQPYSTLIVAADHATGSGDITLRNGATLILRNGESSDYIADTAALIISPATHSISLDFRGQDRIRSLSFDGGKTFVAPGTYGAPNAGAEHTDERFSGSGILSVLE